MVSMIYTKWSWISDMINDSLCNSNSSFHVEAAIWKLLFLYGLFKIFPSLVDTKVYLSLLFKSILSLILDTNLGESQDLLFPEVISIASTFYHKYLVFIISILNSLCFCLLFSSYFCSAEWIYDMTVFIK